MQLLIGASAARFSHVEGDSAPVFYQWRNNSPVTKNRIDAGTPAAGSPQLKEFAEKDGISMNQFIAMAVAEKLAALATVKYLEQRARRGSQEKFQAVLAKVPDVEPEPDDRL